MSESTTATTELTSQYTAQVAGDLERNIKEQDSINGEIAALQEQLTALRHDHSVLVNMQQALGVAPAPDGSTDVQDSATVPAPREKESAEPSAGKRTRAKKADAEPGRKQARKAAAKRPAGMAATAKAAQPTLVELIRGHLTELDGPRSAAEVATALGQAHPERGIKTTVVRTTLEGLVAKNQAQRSKQGASVFYTAADKPESASAPETGAQPDEAE
ncbi:hypothetical protein [Streptomyces chiangmaiensis]|uniref:Regulatory protein n=1 Tax=Streptomyces chiangmaiensis TaxID=766497 RepID=A0ABU7FCD2_9ACTN|nr:hypothetical protein [Streptomyces chiangmaiensis]MED7821483.1 hypothetical protein [Streptomyces chiangmaiensis]